MKTLRGGSGRVVAACVALGAGLAFLVARLSRPETDLCQAVGVSVCMPIMAPERPLWVYFAFVAVGALIGLLFGLPAVTVHRRVMTGWPGRD